MGVAVGPKPLQLPGPPAAGVPSRSAVGEFVVTEVAPGEVRRMDRTAFPALLRAIADAGYRIIGPTVRSGAIVYGEIRSESDLPIGWTERQDAGRYRLERRPDGALFGYAVGPHSWKNLLYPAREKLWTAHRSERSFTVTPQPPDGPPMAFLGMRACEIAAVEVQDRVFNGPVPDPGYAARRTSALRVAVQCGEAGGTCFCVSMKTGPAVTRGYDLSLTEIIDRDGHRFVIQVGSEAGARVLGPVPTVPAAPADSSAAQAVVERTAASMGRTMAAEGVRELLMSNLEHPRWQLVADRCLACTNCTMVCPTCFCSTTEEVPDLNATTVERWRRWDSCFNSAFSQLHSQSVRKTTLSRYRQWLTHKLSTWHDQFGVSGCVGCGRCITWCPVGSDLTEEVAAIRSTAPGGSRSAEGNR